MIHTDGDTDDNMLVEDSNWSIIINTDVAIGVQCQTILSDYLVLAFPIVDTTSIDRMRINESVACSSDGEDFKGDGTPRVIDQPSVGGI